MLYKDFLAHAAIAALPAVINAYKENGESVSWPTYDKDKEDEWQLPDMVARACNLYAVRLAQYMEDYWRGSGEVFFDPDRGQVLNDVEHELAGIKSAVERLV